MDFWVASASWLLWIVMICTWICKYLFENLLSILLDIQLKVELLDCMVVLLLIFWGTSTLFSIEATPFYSPTNSARVSISPYPWPIPKELKFLKGQHFSCFPLWFAQGYFKAVPNLGIGSWVTIHWVQTVALRNPQPLLLWENSKKQWKEKKQLKRVFLLCI